MRITRRDRVNRKRRTLKALFYLLLSGLLAVGGYFGWQEYEDVTKRLALIENRLGVETLECDEQETVARVKKSIVRVLAGESEGSGIYSKT